MVFAKRSRRKSSLFDSKFRDGSGGDFPLRQYLRCREEFSGGIVQVLVTLVFAIMLGLFGRTLNTLFVTHGADLNPAYRFMALGLLVIFILSVLRRLYYKVVELRDLRREMARLQQEMRDST
jgi:hypothetical protein